MIKNKIFFAPITMAMLLFAGCSVGTLRNVDARLTPVNETVTTGQTIQFTFTVGGSPYSTDVTWAVNGATNGNSTIGTISDTGLYTAPASVPSPNTVTISANQQESNVPGNTIAASDSTSLTITGGSGAMPTATITVAPITITAGQSATLTWTTTNASMDICTINGATTVNGFPVGISGSVQVSPTQSTVYKFNCKGQDDSVLSSQAQLTVQPASTTPPTATITVTPDTITAGPNQSATLKWACTNATAANINGSPVDLSGTMQISPAESTTYQLNCTGAGGSALEQAVLTVEPSTSSGITVSIATPITGTMAPGTSMPLAATVANDPSNSGVTWTSIPDSELAVLNPFAATYTAPATVTTITTVTITAKSVADTYVSGTVSITIDPALSTSNPPQAGVSPNSLTMNSGDAQTFVANVSGGNVTNPQGFTWQVIGATGNPSGAIGTITPVPGNSSAAVYQAPTITSGQITVRIQAASTQFNVSGYSTVIVAPPGDGGFGRMIRKVLRKIFK